jgi:RNA polymerase sigma-70 factor (ECF subfamily)
VTRAAASAEQLLEEVPGGRVEQRVDLARASDLELAHALIQGTPEAARVTWRRFAPLVRRILMRSLGPHRDVEDAVQDVFLCVFEKARTLRDPGALRAFVVSVTIRSLRYEIRRRRVRSWLRFEGDSETPDLRSVQVDTDSREALGRFYQMLDRINTRDRTAFVLHTIEGMDLPEVAAAMGLSIPTIRRCLARARDRLSLWAGRDPLLVEYVSRLEVRRVR